MLTMMWNNYQAPTNLWKRHEKYFHFLPFFYLLLFILFWVVYRGCLKILRGHLVMQRASVGFLAWLYTQAIMIIVLNVLIYVHRASICEHILSSLPSPRRNVIYWVAFSHTHLLDCNDDTLRPGSRNESKIFPWVRGVVL